MERFSGTLVTDVASGRPCLRQVDLRVIEGPDVGKILTLHPGSQIIGSHPGVDFPLTDGQISRRHFEIQLLDDGARLRDLGSKNGTFVGDIKIDNTVIAPGSEIFVGATVLLLEACDAPVDIGPGTETFGDLTAKSEPMRNVFALLSRACISDATILLEGETGVGKDVLARTIHQSSPRADGPFLVFDCGAVSPTLIAGELFGHDKGAFTGANAARAGVFEAARGGTVFLDEIGELALDLQPSLLRLLESRQVRRIGENKARDIDVRILAATNRDLRAEVEAGRFREDLFFRLAIIKVEIPSLRERREDIPNLVELFLAANDRPVDSLSSLDLSRMLAHDWPGNVRELRNTISRSSALSPPGKLTLHLDAGTPSGQSSGRKQAQMRAMTRGATNPRGATSPRARPLAAALDSVPIRDLLSLPLKQARAELNARFERAYAEHVLDSVDGNVTRAAEQAEVARNYFHRLLKRHDLKRGDAKRGDAKRGDVKRGDVKRPDDKRAKRASNSTRGTPG